MSGNGPDERPKTAAELMAELARDSDYIARLKERDRKHQASVEASAAAAVPVLTALEDGGWPVGSLDELRTSGDTYRAAIPILLDWLPRVSDACVKDSIVRTLSVPWARPSAAPMLIEEFKTAVDPDGLGLRWTIGNALSVVADDAVFDAVVELVQDKAYGRAREMLALALARMKSPHAVDVLIKLLDDKDVVGHAVIALRELRAVAARTKLQTLSDHPKAWVRKEVRKALAKIDA